MTFAEAVAFVACTQGVTQDVVDALEENFRVIERALDNAKYENGVLQSKLDLVTSQLNLARGQIDFFRATLAGRSDDIPF